MAGISEKLRFILDADTDGAIRGFEKVGASADRDLGRADQKLDKVGASMTKWGALSLAAGGLMAAGLLKAGGAASDLEEAVNVTGLVFGDASDEIGEFAASAATSLGLSETAARTATATFGGLLKNLEFGQTETVGWSKDLTTLAADMASAFNTSTEDAVLAIGSALRGEQEPIRRYNVMLDDAAVRARAVEMGLAATTAEVDNHGKAQARLSLIMEQTSDIQGDFANTADGAANSARIARAQFDNFQANLGQAVVPVMQSALGAANDLFSAFSDLPEPVQEMISKLAVLSTGGLLVGGSLLLVAGKLIDMRKAMGEADGATGRLAAKMALATAAIGVAVAVYQTWTSGSKEQEARTQALTEAIREHGDVVKATTDVVADYLAQNEFMAGIFADARVNTDALAEAAAAGGEEWDAYKDSTLGAAEAAGLSTFEAMKLSSQLDNLAESTKTAEERAADLDAVERTAAEGGDRMARSQRLLDQNLGTATTAMEDEEDAAGDLEAALADTNTETTDFSGAVGELTRMLAGLFTSTTSVIEAESEWERQLDTLTETIATNGATLDQSTKAGQDNLDALVAQRDTIPGLTQAYLDEGLSLDEAETKIREHIAALEDELVQTGLSEDAVQSLLEQIGLTPDQVTTFFDVLGEEEALTTFHDIKRAIDDIPEEKLVTIRYDVIGDTGGPDAFSPQPREPAPAPEPNPRDPGRGIGGLAVAGGITVNNYSADPDRVVRALEKAQREGRIGRLVVT